MEEHSVAAAEEPSHSKTLKTGCHTALPGPVIALERTQGIGTTIKSFSGGFVYSYQHPLAIFDIETTEQRLES